jgi:tetratricopeptide (TPR) repeat protein
MLHRQPGVWRVALCASLFMLVPFAPARGEPQPPVPPAAAAAPAPNTDDLANAQLHFQAGSTAYEAGDFTTAIQEWKAAQQLRPAPLLNFNIGLAYEQLGRSRAACKYYLRYFAEVPQAPERQDIEARLKCSEALATTQPSAVPPPAASPPGTSPVPPPSTAAAPGSIPATQRGATAARPPSGASPGAPSSSASANRRAAAARAAATPPTKAKKSRWWIVFPVLAGAALAVGIVALAAGASQGSRPPSRDFDLTPLPSDLSQGGAPLFRF